MSSRDYVVVENDDHWSIDLNGHKAGSFDSESDATDAALRLAKEARGLGHASRVLARRGDRLVEVPVEEKSFAPIGRG